MELSTLFEGIFQGNENLDLEAKSVRQPKPRTENEPRRTSKVKNTKPMSTIEIKNLALNIKKLKPIFLRGVLEIVKPCLNV